MNTEKTLVQTKAAIEAMSSPVDRVYRPIPENVAVYDQLYTVYKTLHDKFGGEERHLIQTLNQLRNCH